MNNKILIADDSKLVLSLVKSIFIGQNDRFNVITANDGREAIEKAVVEKPDIILMDWQMPEMSGIEALRILKQNDKTKDIPVIMLTASETTTEAFDNGASDFIQKPFNKDELIARVHTILDAVNSKKELKQKLVEIEIERDKLKIQKEILIRQRKDMIESITLAWETYKYMYLINNNIEKYFDEGFVLSVPVNEVPSNFIWSRKTKSSVYFCLGYLDKHGTQSILFSSALIKLLDDIALTFETEHELTPAETLSLLMESLIKMSDNEIHPLVDIVLCAFDTEKKILKYAGVNLPLFVMKNDKLVELKTEKSTTGFLTKGLQISHHKVQLAQNDLIYIMNDGFIDKKASSDRSYISDELINMVRKITKKDMDKQKVLFNKTFENWKKDLKQQNDILILGIKC
jgi:phosphoserine phosphatase RsbU/P